MWRCQAVQTAGAPAPAAQDRDQGTHERCHRHQCSASRTAVGGLRNAGLPGPPDGCGTLQESHCTSIRQLLFNLVDPNCRNLFATVGHNQATVYDDQHMGDHIDVVVQYAAEEEIDAAGQDLRACAWLNTRGWTQHPQGDSCLAVAGVEGVISIISVAEARVTRQLHGHHAAVIELSAAAEQPGLLLSLSKDGNVRLWDVGRQKCLLSLKTDAYAVAVHPSGSCFITSNRQGKLHRWQLTHPPASADALHDDQQAAGNAQFAVASNVRPEQLKLPGMEGSNTIDCIRFLPGAGDRLATKASDGKMAVTALEDMQRVASWRVPGQAAGTSYDTRCSFSHTSDGDLICVGNNQGTTYVYETTTGRQACRADPIRVKGPVRACGLSEDCRHLLAVVGNGFIFRFEYARPRAPVQEQMDVAAAEGDAVAMGDQQLSSDDEGLAGAADMDAEAEPAISGEQHAASMEVEPRQQQQEAGTGALKARARTSEAAELTALSGLDKTCAAGAAHHKKQRPAADAEAGV